MTKQLMKNLHIKDYAGVAQWGDALRKVAIVQVFSREPLASIAYEPEDLWST